MTQQTGDTTQHFEPETVEQRNCFNERIGESPKWSMKQIVAVPLIAITSLLGVQFVSATLAVAQQGQAESPQRDVLLPPRVDRVRLRATAIYWGMSAAEVDQTMGAAADEETYQGMDGNVRVLTYPREAIPTKITISDGKVASVALDIAGIDARLPAYSRSAWPGMHRTVVLRMLGVPVEDRFYDSFGMKLEHMIFERPAQPDISIFLLDERVVTKKMGRGLPPDVLGLSLPLALDRADEESDARGTGHIKELVRVGMTEGAVKALFGAPKLLVHYGFKGRASQYGLYQTAPDGSFGRFTFVDGVLSEFVDGGRTLLSQILNGG